MFTSSAFAPPRTCSSATSTAPGEVVGLDQAAEARRAGDVRALADQHEAGVRADLERLEAAPARPVRRLRRHARREPAHGGGDRRRCARDPSRSSFRRRSGSPPARTRAGARSSPRASRRSRRRRSAARRSGARSRGTAPHGARSATYERISCAPSEQLMPTISGSACSTDAQKASIVWPGERPPGAVDDRRRDPERELAARSRAPPRSPPWR